MRANRFASRSCWAMAVIGAVVLTANAKEPANPPAAAKSVKVAAATKESADGRELFTREWLPNDSRSHGGDGLGPVFNDSSCVACHNQGGIGGGGAASKNVDIVTAFPQPTVLMPAAENTLPQALFNSLFGALAPPAPTQPRAKPMAHSLTVDEKKAAQKREKEQLAKIHPAFASTRSVVLHHFGTDPKYQEWRSQIASGQFQQQVIFKESGFRTVTRTEAAIAVAEPATTGPNSNEPQLGPQPDIGAEPAPAALASKPSEENPEAPQRAPVPQQEAVGVQPIGPNVAFSSPPVLNFVTPTGLATANIPEVSQLQNEVRMNRGQLLGSTSQIGTVQISRSQRNATALFGIGLIDGIPEQVILDLAKQEADKYPAMAGRPSKQKDGHIGRFGWKAQKPTLEDFALTACAVELGLEVPGHEQAGVALKPDYKAPGLDMNKAECNALVSYLNSLPKPVERKPANAQEAAVIKAGHKQFEAVGCANCHVQQVGAVNGLYSDLLLHEMGPDLGDAGDYGIFIHDMPEEDQQELPPQIIEANPNNPQQQAKTAKQLAKLTGALRQEWRTPPLWGVRDSGPYLHDGRADTLEQAIAFHGGQAAPATVKFFELKPEQRQQVITFLKSLTAPEAAGPEAAAKVAGPTHMANE
jgi:CxxC motif-containing protein (DUF1111 family)